MRHDTPFHFASIAKLHTATVVLQLWEPGGLDRDAPMAAHLPRHPQRAAPDRRRRPQLLGAILEAVTGGAFHQ
jgi:CubicO group peptidase (beta-lactamase class C family)